MHHSTISVEERQCNNQPDKRHKKQCHNKRGWCNERQRHWQMEGGGVRRGYATAIQTRGTRGDGMKRGMTTGDGVMKGRVASR
jgi:hypothetical protein